MQRCSPCCFSVLGAKQPALTHSAVSTVQLYFTAASSLQHGAGDVNGRTCQRCSCCCPLLQETCCNWTQCSMRFCDTCCSAAAWLNTATTAAACCLCCRLCSGRLLAWLFAHPDMPFCMPDCCEPAGSFAACCTTVPAAKPSLLLVKHPHGMRSCLARLAQPTCPVISALCNTVDALLTCCTTASAVQQLLLLTAQLA
jgi:hypothetical protein